MPDKGEFKIGYIPALDGLRAFAIIAVILFHAEIPGFRGGFIGVDLFFVLSGFLITSLLIEEYGKRGVVSLKNFYIRRILRLFPALILMLSVFVILNLIFVERSKASDNITDSLIVLFYSANWTRALGFGRPDWLGHAWSLSIEEQFYLLWPVIFIILLKFVRNRSKLILFTAAIALGSLLVRWLLTYYGNPPYRMFNGLDTRADGLLTGCSLSIILHTNNFRDLLQRTESVRKYLLPLSVLLIILSLFLSSWSHKLNMYIGFTAVNLSASVLIYSIVLNKAGILQRLLVLPAVVWIGKISYGLYLWHDTIFSVMAFYGFSKYEIFFWGTGLTFCAAVLSYYLIEQPFLKLKNKYSQMDNKKERKAPIDTAEQI